MLRAGEDAGCGPDTGHSVRADHGLGGGHLPTLDTGTRGLHVTPEQRHNYLGRCGTPPQGQHPSP